MGYEYVFIGIVFLIMLYFLLRFWQVNKYLMEQIKYYENFVNTLSNKPDTSIQEEVVMCLIRNGIQPIDIAIIGDPVFGVAAYQEKDTCVNIYKIDTLLEKVRIIEKKANIIQLPYIGVTNET